MNNNTFSTEEYKNADKFIKGIAKRASLLAEYRELMKPICEEQRVSNEWDIPQDYWKSTDWMLNKSITRIKCQLIGAKVIRINRMLKRTKWAYWAINPKGTPEYYRLTETEPAK